MKIVRDNLGHICQINYDDGSEIKNEKEAYDFIIADEKEITEREKEITEREIAKEKEITEREKEKTNKEEKRCNFFIKCTSIATTAAEAIIAGIDEYNRQQSLNNNNLNSESSEEEIH